MKLIKVISSLFVLGLFLVPSNVKATHIVGGEITYRCLANWTFEVTLTLRRDCEFGSKEAQFDDPASVGIYDKSGELLWWLGQGGQLSIPFNQDDTLNTEYVPGCDFLGQGVCVHTSTYIDTITLPFRPGGYILAYSRCCRNETLTNITDPLQTGTTYSVALTNKAALECNNSPTFDESPALYICANEELVADMSATDPDGDSLVYRLCVPQDGASPENPQPQPPRGPLFEEVNFVSGFGVDNFLGGVPLTIDSETGIITATPNLVGQFLVGVCVDEYRDGELISSIKRDFEYNVRECIEGPNAEFTLENDPQCDGLEVTFTNTSTETDAYEWYFDFPNEDPAFKSTEESPTFTYPEEGFYTIKLISTRSADGCFSEFTKELGVFDSEVEAIFDVNFLTNECLDDSLDITLVSTSVEPNPDYEIELYEWTLSGEGYEASGSGETFRIIAPILDSISVTLKVTSETGCTDEISQTINTTENGLFASFEPDFEILECGDDSITVTLVSNSGSNNPAVTITDLKWTFNFGDFMTMGDVSPITVTLPREDSIRLLLEVSGSNGCMASLDTILDVQTINDEDIEFLSDTIGICPGDTTFLLASPNSDLIYTWTPEDGLIFDGDDRSNPKFTLAEGQKEAVYSLEVSDGNCSRGAGEVVIIDLSDAEPAEIAFTSVPMCGTTTVCFENISTPADGNYEFDFGSDAGMVDSMNNMICYTYDDFGLFKVTLNYLGGCGDQSFSRNLIVAPDVEINVDSDTIVYCTGEELNLVVTSETDGTVVEWYDEDENLIGEEFEITYNPEGDELLTVIGFNAGGCFDTAMIQLIEYKLDIEIDGPEIACAGDDATITITDNSGGNLTYVWTPEDAISGSNTGNEIVANADETTTFIISITNEDNGCILDTSFTLNVSDVSVELEADPIEVFQCNPTDISVVDENPDYTYEWNTGATTPSFTTDTLLETTTFSVTVTDENGCTAEASITINVLLPDCDENDVFLPTAFTPNGDNVNDVLKVESNFVKKMNLQIYDRWGELVFSTTNIDEGWDGSYEGKILAPDVYAYSLSATCSNGAVFNKVGNVTLIR
ncbi:T9SS type B sorting domain-containing protein [Portibacter lacus]|nr:gliding motility-associated C-terminal domain-containing protein [Portibacter lacus]